MVFVNDIVIIFYKEMIRRTIVLTRPCYLQTRNDQLVIRYPADIESDKIVPIEDIGLIILESQQTTVTNGLLIKLAANKTAVISCDNKHMPAALMLPMEGHTLMAERYRHQIEASIPLKRALWKQTIKSKIINQGKVLESLGKDSKPLVRWCKKVSTGDAGFHESRAAAYYWPKLIGSQDFRRDPMGDPPNNLFNYAYAILRAIIARALVGSGLLPSLGIFHKNKYNAYALADDIMEPYRPFADTLVMDIYLEGQHSMELTKENKVHILKIPTVDVIMEGKRSPLLVAASRTSNSLYECFAGNRRKLIYPEYEVYTKHKI